MLATDCIYVFRITVGINSDYFLNSIKRLTLAMEKSGVLFDVGTELLNIV
jgi:hypothetical protein